MSAPVDSERKGHKRKLADTFTYSNAVAGINGGEKETITVQARAFECQKFLGAVFSQLSEVACADHRSDACLASLKFVLRKHLKQWTEWSSGELLIV